jgi:hypothetical protein
MPAVSFINQRRTYMTRVCCGIPTRNHASTDESVGNGILAVPKKKRETLGVGNRQYQRATWHMSQAKATSMVGCLAECLSMTSLLYSCRGQTAASRPLPGDHLVFDEIRVASFVESPFCGFDVWCDNILELSGDRIHEARQRCFKSMEPGQHISHNIQLRQARCRLFVLGAISSGQDVLKASLSPVPHRSPILMLSS